jgi:hypothetical protein
VGGPSDDRRFELALVHLPAPLFKARLRANLEKRIANMTVTTPAAVPAGFQNLTPYLLVSDVDAILTFYAAAFGAQTCLESRRLAVSTVRSGWAIRR